MKARLFDASSIILLAKKHPEKAPTTLTGEHILDLTIYEIGNAIWKINKLVKKTDKPTAIGAIEQAYHLTALMNIIKIQSLYELSATMENAFDHSLTFYDSAYLTAAYIHKATLVTEDKRLAEAAQEANIPTIDTDTLIKTT